MNLSSLSVIKCKMEIGSKKRFISLASWTKSFDISFRKNQLLKIKESLNSTFHYNLTYSEFLATEVFSHASDNYLYSE